MEKEIAQEEKNLSMTELIYQYMYFKIKLGYENYVTRKEFTDFLIYYKDHRRVEEVNISVLKSKTIDILGDFIESEKHKWVDKKGESYPHFILKDDTLTATNLFSEDDFELHKEYHKLNKQMINDFLIISKKRELDASCIKEESAEKARYINCFLVELIWKGYINKLKSEGKWPIQCNDINKYLLQDFDLATIINIPSIKEDILEFMKITNKRLKYLISTDPELRISNDTDSILAAMNYEFLIQENKDLYKSLFKYVDNRAFEIDLANDTFNERAKKKDMLGYDNDISSKSYSLDQEGLKKYRII